MPQLRFPVPLLRTSALVLAKFGNVNCSLQLTTQQRLQPLESRC